MPSISHQRRAARLRHAASTHEKFRFWAELTTSYEELLARHPSVDLKRFIAIARQRCNCMRSMPYKKSTYFSWIREWARIQVGQKTEYRAWGASPSSSARVGIAA